VKLLRICLFCFVVFLGGEAAALATSIPFTGSFGNRYPNGYTVDITGPSFSLIGDTIDGSPVGFCTPGDTCSAGLGISLFYDSFNNVVGTIGNQSGYTFNGYVSFQGSFTAPAFDPNTWYNGGPSEGYINNFDAGPMTFSGSADAWSCDPTGLSAPCAPVNYEIFSVNLSGTADAQFLLFQNGNIFDGSYNVLSGTATVTYLIDPPPSPAPEPTTLLLVSSGLAALLLLGRRMRPQPLL